MQINKIQKKIRALELFGKVKNIENKKSLMALAEKRVILDELKIDSHDVAHEIDEIEKGMIANSATFSVFNVHQKYHYLLALDEYSSTLSLRLAVNQREISVLENKLKVNSGQKNKVEEKIEQQYNILSCEIEKKRLYDLR